MNADTLDISWNGLTFTTAENFGQNVSQFHTKEEACCFAKRYCYTNIRWLAAGYDPLTTTIEDALNGTYSSIPEGRGRAIAPHLLAWS